MIGFSSDDDSVSSIVYDIVIF